MDESLNENLGKDLSKMRDASYLLPPPGGEVVRELLDEIQAWQKAAENWDCTTPKELEERIFALPEIY